MAVSADATDEAITKAVQAGDSNAFSVLVTRYEQKIARYAKRFLLGGEDGKDIVQEVFIKAYINIKSFDASRRFSPWLYRIAHNEFVNAIKKRSKSPVFSFDFDTLFPHPVAKETADSEMSRNELKEMLEKSLDQIDVKYREPLVLYYFEELDYGEIAQVLQIPASTVGVRLKRGRDMLKTIVKKYE